MVRKVFFSFHFDNDVFRVQQIRNIGALQDNKPISTNEWETVKRGGDVAIKRWIDNTIKNCDCVVVLIGSETANRPLVKYEIQRAWETGKGIFGIYIHNLRDPRTGKCLKGANPFDNLLFTNGSRLSTKIKAYDPNPNDAYNDIRNGIGQCVEIAIRERNY